MPLTDQEFFDNYLNCVIKYIVDNGFKYDPNKVNLIDNGNGISGLAINQWNYDLEQPSNSWMQANYELQEVDYQFSLYKAQTSKSNLPSLTLVQWEQITDPADNLIVFITDDGSLRLYNNGSWVIYQSSTAPLASEPEIKGEIVKFLEEDQDLKEIDKDFEIPESPKPTEKKITTPPPSPKKKRKSKKGKQRKNSESSPTSMVEVQPEEIPETTPLPKKKSGWW